MQHLVLPHDGGAKLLTMWDEGQDAAHIAGTLEMPTTKVLAILEHFGRVKPPAPKPTHEHDPLVTRLRSKCNVASRLSHNELREIVTMLLAEGYIVKK
jgi:hypothetical protein